MFDVVIAGGSFAGLAVAGQLRGHRALIIDPKPIGCGQTSACGTMLQVLKYWNLMPAVVHTHRRLVLHVPGRVLELPSPYLWSTFDYELLCRRLFRRCGAEFMRARVTGYDRGWVHTNRGRIEARVIVDASGWRAALASSLDPQFAGKTGMNFGIESVGPPPEGQAFDPKALHFWYPPPIGRSDTMAWLFPRGRQVSVGLGSYGTSGHLGRYLQTFGHQIGAEIASQGAGLHGSYLPFRLRPVSIEGLFVVGDAAGMCLGLTGEGIRPALYFGEACGRIVRGILEGRLSEAYGHREYAAFVNRRRRFFSVFTGAQTVFRVLPAAWVQQASRLANNSSLRSMIFQKYWDLTREWGPPE